MSYPGSTDGTGFNFPLESNAIYMNKIKPQCWLKPLIFLVFLSSMTICKKQLCWLTALIFLYFQVFLCSEAVCWKQQCWLKTPNIFILSSLCSMAVCRHVSGRCHSFLCYLSTFLLFHLFRFSFYIKLHVKHFIKSNRGDEANQICY